MLKNIGFDQFLVSDFVFRFSGLGSAFRVSGSHLKLHRLLRFWVSVLGLGFWSVGSRVSCLW